MSGLAHLAKYTAEHGCLKRVDSFDDYSIQIQASYSATQDMILLTSSNGDLHISVPRQKLLKDSDKKTPHLIITKCQNQFLRAFPVTYNIGQVFYDIKENKCWKIVDIPLSASSNWEREMPVPIYTVEYSSTVGTMEVAETDSDLDSKMVVGPKHQAAASTRIAKWYKRCRSNRLALICQKAVDTVNSRGPGSFINQLCRDGKRVGELRKSIKQSPKNWNINKENHLTKKTALNEAVEHHNGAAIKLLVHLGADQNVRTGETGEFILHKILRDTSPGAIETTRLLLSLSETKADPDGQYRSSDSIASSDGKRYWLEVSRHRKHYRKEDMIKMGIPHLPEFSFALCGQPYAQWKMAKDISTSLANQESYNRLVFLLGGPPGHGKTMAAEMLSRVLGEDAQERDFLKISCANLNSVIELFGGGGAYQGSEVGSELNNFVVNHRDRIGVVNLDEFDRLNPEVRDGLFTIFDKGEWVDKKLSSQTQSKTLDCKKIIWILTTNAFDNKILSFYKQEYQRFQQRNWLDIQKRVKTTFRGNVKTQFGDAMARRIGSLIPFVPFTKPERVAFVENDIDIARAMYATSPVHKGSIKLVGNFKFTVSPEVISLIADQYDEQQGITSLKDFIKEEIHDVINDEHFEGDIPENPENTEGPLEKTVGHFSLLGSEGDEEIVFNWPIKPIN